MPNIVLKGNKITFCLTKNKVHFIWPFNTVSAKILE